MHSRVAVNGDLPLWAAVLACALALVSLGVLAAYELRRRERGGPAIVLTGLLAVGALVLAVLRPVRIAARESVIGAKVVVLADTSRSMALPDGSVTRLAARDHALAEIAKKADSARLLVLGFGDGPPKPLANDGHDAKSPAPGLAARTDLASALRSLAASAEERPQAIVVVSDGNLDDPGEEAPKEAFAALGKDLRVPIHGVATTR